MSNINKFISSFLLFGMATVSATAQTAGNGNTVKRIEFDRENITVSYTDGTKEENVQTTRIVNNRKTAVKSIPGNGRQQTASRTWYTLDGRRMQGAPLTTDKGVFIMREGNKVRRTIKK